MIIEKNTILFKLSRYTCEKLLNFHSEKQKCERGNHAWLAININAILHYWDSEKLNISMFKVKKNIRLMDIYKPENYKLIKNKILNHHKDIVIDSDFMKLELSKFEGIESSNHKYWKYTNNQKIFFLFKFAFGLRMSVHEQEQFVKEIIKIDKKLLKNTQKSFQPNIGLYETFELFSERIKKVKNKNIKNQRLSMTELDIILLYALCNVFEEYNGWYVGERTTVFNMKENLEEIALLNTSKYIECYKKLKMKIK